VGTIHPTALPPQVVAKKCNPGWCTYCVVKPLPQKKCNPVSRSFWEVILGGHFGRSFWEVILGGHFGRSFGEVVWENCTKRFGMLNAEVFLRILQQLKIDSELGHLLSGPAAFELS
jgi:hypothetical protein